MERDEWRGRSTCDAGVGAAVEVTVPFTRADKRVRRSAVVPAVDLGSERRRDRMTGCTCVQT